MTNGKPDEGITMATQQSQNELAYMSFQETKEYGTMVNKAFQEWLLNRVGNTSNGKPVTRLMQVRMGPAPDLILGWLEIGFKAGFGLSLESQQDGKDLQVQEHAHSAECSHGEVETTAPA